jgi:hypothetical protein
VGLFEDIPTCAELVSRIITDAEELITGRLAELTTAPDSAIEPLNGGDPALPAKIRVSPSAT